MVTTINKCSDEPTVVKAGYPILGHHCPQEWFETIMGLAREVHGFNPDDIVIRLDSQQIKFPEKEEYYAFFQILKGTICYELAQSLKYCDTYREAWEVIYAFYGEFDLIEISCEVYFAAK